MRVGCNVYQQYIQRSRGSATAGIASGFIGVKYLIGTSFSLETLAYGILDTKGKVLLCLWLSLHVFQNQRRELPVVWISYLLRGLLQLAQQLRE
jgi:hypothetical protein